jgi:response regulator RpfG family c-di-GMP phosphodiesterase
MSEIHLVDDSDDEVFLTRILLQRDRVAMKVVHHPTYESIKNFLEEIDEKKPILLVVDLNMPAKNGVEIISDLKTRAEERSIVMGICTGSEDPADRRQSINTGAQFFVNKPFSLKRLHIICEQTEKFKIRSRADSTVELFYTG